MESAPNTGDQSAVSLLRDSRNHVVFIVLYPNSTAQTQTLRLSIWRMRFLMRFALRNRPENAIMETRKNGLTGRQPQASSG